MRAESIDWLSRPRHDRLDMMAKSCCTARVAGIVGSGTSASEMQIWMLPVVVRRSMNLELLLATADWRRKADERRRSVEE